MGCKKEADMRDDRFEILRRHCIRRAYICTIAIRLIPCMEFIMGSLLAYGLRKRPSLLFSFGFFASENEKCNKRKKKKQKKKSDSS